MKSWLARFSVLTVGLAAVSSNLDAAAEKTKASEKVKDLAGRVEVVPSGRLRPVADGHARVRVSLWNATENDIVGPIFLIVDSTGIKDVAVANNPERTAAGKGVFEVVPAGEKILPHGMTKPVSMSFATPKGFDQGQANEFKLKARVFGREIASQYSIDKHADDDFATRGKSYDAAALQNVIAIQERAMADMMKKPGVLGMGITENSKGELAMRVYTETRGQAKALPGSVEGVPVDVKPVPGGFSAGPARDSVIYQDGKALSKASREAARAASAPSKVGASAAPGGDPTIRFDRPVPIGSSSINAIEVCASGTLGARVRDSSGKLYALSNSHVFARESVAALGEPIVQPSQGDNNCLTNLPDNQIGILADFVNFNLDDPAVPLGQTVNFMDTGLMEVQLAKDPTGADVPSVGFETPEDGYGAPSSKILRVNRIGLQVQKYGRTTIYTRGFTSATNVFSLIAYSNGLVAFFNMDEFFGTAPNFSLGQPGDSGSLIVTVADRRPVSLLFAGGGNVTFGNPIGRILDRFNVTIDDGSEVVTTAGTGNTGTSGRMGTAIEPIGQNPVIQQLLPPELQGRIRNPDDGLLNPGPLDPG